MMCELKPYCNKNCEECNFGKWQQETQRMHEAMQNLKNTITQALSPIVDSLVKAVHAFLDRISDCNSILHTYPNKKVVHLALHHPKERVRKKNTKRIMKWIGKQKGDSENEGA